MGAAIKVSCSHRLEGTGRVGNIWKLYMSDISRRFEEFNRMLCDDSDVLRTSELLSVQHLHRNFGQQVSLQKVQRESHTLTEGKGTFRLVKLWSNVEQKA